MPEEEIEYKKEISADILETVFEVDVIDEDADDLLRQKIHDIEDLDADEIDIAFQANDEDYW
jgi:uncharacterized protein YnzC (UPF0291/DUF896 family)